jgi:hypothetical protein
MSASRVIKLMLAGTAVVEDYLNQCRVRNPLVEKEISTHVPPTPEETKKLIAYLRSKDLKPAIVGSVGILRHLGDIDVKKSFRPTVDLDIWVQSVPAPPPGWTVDPESPGVVSWISPTGGYVDFLTPGHEFAGSDVRNPDKIEIDSDSAMTDYPVGSWKSLLFLKLNSVRDKDLADAMALCRRFGRVPEYRELGHLNQTQRENLDLVRTWYKLRPSGNYGE